MSWVERSHLFRIDSTVRFWPVVDRVALSASDRGCVKTPDPHVFRGLFTIPDLEKMP